MQAKVVNANENVLSICHSVLNVQLLLNHYQNAPTRFKIKKFTK